MNRYPIVDQLEAELEARRSSLGATEDDEETLLRLELLGDALRADARVPQEFYAWSEGLEEAALETALQLGAEILDALILPHDNEDDTNVDMASLGRDRVESLRVSVRRTCIATDRLAWSLARFSQLEDTVRRFDGALADRVDRQRVEMALGERRGLLVGASWTDVLSEEDPRAGSSQAPSVASSRLGQPSDAHVAEYIAGGENAAWVEAIAERDQEFSEALESLITLARELRDEVSLVARRWQKRSAPADQRGVVVPIEFARAAASEATVRTTARVPLGNLYPTRTEARLEISEHHATLVLTFEPKSVKRIRFGAATAEPGPGDETAALEQSLSESPWRIEVVGDDARFEIVLGVESPDP